MTTPSYLAAYRTHFWDEGTAKLADRFKQNCASGKMVVLYDVTHAAAPLLNDFEILEHTDDVSVFGLPQNPAGKTLWYNADYALYFLHQAFPDFDYYILSEYDVAVNTDIDIMMRDIAARRLDLAAHEIEKSTPEWGWNHHNASKLFETPWKSLIPFIVVSRQAVLALLDQRRQHASNPEAVNPANLAWTFCESFIPTVIYQTPGMQVAQLEEWADVSALRWRPFIMLSDPQADTPNALLHPVISLDRFLEAAVPEQRLFDLVMSGEPMPPPFCDAPFNLLLTKLQLKLLGSHNGFALAALIRELYGRGLIPDPAATDIACCKPALTSSVCEHSFSQDPEKDAAGANMPLLLQDMAFHTALEERPWWRVDLLDFHRIEEIWILNRDGCQDRFRHFTIESSEDAANWITRFTKSDSTGISSDPAAPWRHRFPTPFRARFIRIKLLGHGILHLRRVQIFGARQVIAAPNPVMPLEPAAFETPAIQKFLAQTIPKTVEQELFGRRMDSYHIEKLGWLSAGLSTADYALNNMQTARRFETAHDLLTFALSQVRLEGLFLEFGVFSGRSITHMANTRPRDMFYGFDSFEGLPETWRPGFPKGAFALEHLPAVPANVELVKGWFDNSLPDFCAAHQGKKAAFIHVDCDLYSSAKTVFAALRPFIVPGSIIAFDEYFNYPGWQQHEYKALREFCQAHGVIYEYIALVPGHQQAAIRILECDSPG